MLSAVHVPFQDLFNRKWQGSLLIHPGSLVWPIGDVLTAQILVVKRFHFGTVKYFRHDDPMWIASLNLISILTPPGQSKCLLFRLTPCMERLC